jgi:hypothetical protein
LAAVRLALAAVAAALLVVSAPACGGSSARHPGKPQASGAASPWWQTTPTLLFGYARSLTPLAHGYLLRLDLVKRFGPDETGLHACADNHECPAGTSDFPDDTYDHDFRYVVTYYIAPATPVDLVGAGLATTPRVTARYFYGMIRGRNPRRVRTMMRAHDLLPGFGFYVEIGHRHGPTHRLTDYESVERMAQIYHP